MKNKEQILQVIENNSGPSLEMSLQKFGEQSIKKSRALQQKIQVETMKILPEISEDSELSQTIIEASTKTSELSPSNVTEKFLYKIPIDSVRKWLIKRYITSFKDGNQVIMDIFQRLEDGKEDLLRKMISLESQYKSLMETDKELDHDIALGKEVLAQLEALDEDTKQQLKYQMAISKISRRIRDLTTIKSAIQQFFVSINQTIENQALLNESIDSIMLVGPMVLNNGIMIYNAINKQKQVAEATREVSSTLNNVMKQNASMIKDNAKNIEQMYENPVIALEALETSYKDLQEAVNTTQTAMKNSSTKAMEMTKALEAMQKEFKPIEENLKREIL